MKKWPLLFAALAVVMIGCAGGGDAPAGGGGGGAGGGGGGGGNTGRSTAAVNLGDTGFGLLDFYLLPGAGRLPGSLTAVVGNVTFESAGFDPRDIRDDNPSQSELFLKLDAFNAQNRPLSVTLGLRDSRPYENFTLDIKRMLQEDDNGNLFTITNPAVVAQLSVPNIMSLSVFEGRVSVLQIFMNEQSLNVVNTQNQGTIVDFDEATFIQQNRSPISNRIQGFLSDYVRFDISQVPTKPTLLNAGKGTVNAVYLNGDNYALSLANPKGVNGSTGYFEVLTPFGTLNGEFLPPIPEVGNLKIYQVLQNDPSDVSLEPRQIASLKGIYRDYTEVISSLGPVEFITFPKTGDIPRQEVAMIQRNGAGAIANMWFGQVDFSVAPNPTFKLFPINQVQPASAANQINGVITRASLKGKNGAGVSITGSWWQKVRSGDYTITNPPAGFPATFQTGRFITFRK